VGSATDQVKDQRTDPATDPARGHVHSEGCSAADGQRRRRTTRLLAAAANADGDERRSLLNQVVVLNMSVAEALAQRYRGRGIDAEDLRQVACLALVKAANGFDVDHNDAEFLTYAVPTIRGELRKHFRDRGWMVRPPRWIQELQPRMMKASEEVTARVQRLPAPHDLAVHLQVEESDILEALSAAGCFTPYSLDHPQELGSGTFGDREGAEDPGHLAAEARIIIAPLLQTLAQRDQHMIRRRFYDGWTQREVGDELGISQMQVSRHLSRILATLRKQMGDLAAPSTAA
jgi:RNA polymerase sigma-B factor